MPRNSLLIGTLITLVIGVVLAINPFVGPEDPLGGAVEDLPHIDISELPVGGYMFHDGDVEQGRYGIRYFIVRHAEQTYDVHYMLRNEHGDTMMPDLYWWRAGWPCKNFGPTTEEGKITESSVMQCHDRDENGGRPNNQWKITGEAIDHEQNDMDRIKKYMVKGKYLIIGVG